MDELEIISQVTQKFDDNPDWRLVSTLEEVIDVFKSMESFIQDELGLVLESEITEEDFEDLEISEDPDNERTEIKFEVPIAGYELMFEFFYFKTLDGYITFADVDYYMVPEDDESDSDE